MNESMEQLFTTKRKLSRASMAIELLRLCEDLKNQDSVENFKEKKDLTKIIEEEYATINPLICKNCEYKWRLSERERCFLFDCVSDEVEYVTGRNKLRACLLNLNLDKNKYEIIRKSNIHDFQTLYCENMPSNFQTLRNKDMTLKKDIVFKPIDISEELKNICNETYVCKLECPYFIEHKLCELNRKFDKKFFGELKGNCNESKNM